ncbi:MAG: AI-2E family transporter [Caldilineaceae bacterium]
MARNPKQPIAQKKSTSIAPAAAPIEKATVGVDGVVIPATYADQSPLWSVATKSIIAVAVLALAVLVIWRFQSLLTPLVLATMLAYLLNPPISWLADRFQGRRGLATLLIYLMLLVLFLGASTAIGFVAVEQISRLVALFDSAPELVARLQGRVETLTAQTISFGPIQIALSSIINWNVLQTLAQQATSLIRPVFSTSGIFITGIFGATVNTVSNLALIFIISLYLAKDSRQIGNRLVELAGQSGYRADTERLLRDFTRIWNAYLRGQVILGLVIFLVVWLSLAILGVSNALGLGILAGVLEFLPIIGPLVSAGAAILVAIFQDSNWLELSPLYYALTVALVMMLIQQLENNLLVPRIVGGALDLHELLVMISVIMGASLAGILGAVLAAPVVASIKLLGSYGWRKLLDLPPFPEPEVIPKVNQHPRRLATWLRRWW